MSRPSIWVVRVPKGEEYIEVVRRLGLVAVGFLVPSSLERAADRDEVKRLYREDFPRNSGASGAS